MLTTDLPVLRTDPFDPAVLGNPYPFHHELLDLGPLFWVEKYQTYGTASYEVVRSILRNWEHFSVARGVGLSDITKPGAWREPGPLVEIDPPQHTAVRSVMLKVMSPKVIRGWREFLHNAAVDLMERTLPRKEFDVVPDLAEEFIIYALPNMLGVDADRENLLIIGNHNFNTIGPNNAIFQATLEQVNAISEWYDAAASSESMHEGGMGELVFKAEQAGDLEPGNAYKLVRSLLRGGFDTTISAIGSMMLQFARNPDQYRKLREDRKRIMNAFEEAIRLEPPSQTFYRTAMPGAEIAGHSLVPGTKIQVWISAANRDPRQWTDPDRYDIYRDTSGLLSFGDGAHRCLGQMIARLEIEVFLQALLDRVESIELAGEPKFRISNTLRTLDTLPVRVKLA